MLGVMLSQEVPAEHVKLLDEEKTARLEALAAGLDLNDHADQRAFVERIERASGLESEEGSAADMALEYLLIVHGLVIGDVCIEVRQHPDACPNRRIHLAKEAHARRKQECAQRRRQEQQKLRKLEFRDPLLTAAS